jgi:alpha-tubulin suppressor-like RCC1 family protein
MRFAERLISNTLGGMCGLNTDGKIACWGLNQRERFGLASFVCELGCGRPIEGPGGFVSIAGSATTNCGLTMNSRVYCWGDNQHGQLTDPFAGDTSGSPLLFRLKTIG